MSLNFFNSFFQTAKQTAKESNEKKIKKNKNQNFFLQRKHVHLIKKTLYQHKNGNVIKRAHLTVLLKRTKTHFNQKKKKEAKPNNLYQIS